jgi:putative membrane protein
MRRIFFTVVVFHLEEFRMFRSTLVLSLVGSAAWADAEDYGHMMGYGHGYAMLFGPILWLVFLGLIVAGIIWFTRRLDQGDPSGRKSGAIAELDMRLARGEIDTEDYTARKKLLGG